MNVFVLNDGRERVLGKQIPIDECKTLIFKNGDAVYKIVTGGVGGGLHDILNAFAGSYGIPKNLSSFIGQTLEAFNKIGVPIPPPKRCEIQIGQFEGEQSVLFVQPYYENCRDTSWSKQASDELGNISREYLGVRMMLEHEDGLSLLDWNNLVSGSLVEIGRKGSFQKFIDHIRETSIRKGVFEPQT